MVRLAVKMASIRLPRVAFVTRRAAIRAATRPRSTTLAAWRTAAGPAFDVFRGLGRAVQDASERCRDLARMERLGEQLTDAGRERLLRQERAAIPAHQHDRQIGPMAAQHTRQPRPGEPGHDFIGDDDVELPGRGLERGECGVAIGE